MISQSRPRPRNWTAITFAASGLIVLVLAAYAAFATAPPRQPSAPVAAVASKISASLFCQRQVRDRLRAPSTADFGWGDGEIISRYASGWSVMGNVTASNAFGVPVRTGYHCQLAETPGTAALSLISLNLTP